MKKHTTTNRVLLALLGLVLLGGGLLVLAGGADIYRRWNLSPPADWPLTTPQDVLIPRADQASWPDQGWWWPTAIAALALLMLLALVWLLSQIPWRRPRALPVSDTPEQAVAVSDHVLADALTTDLGLLPGTRRAQAHIHGPSARPQARIDLTLNPGSAPAQLLEDIHDAVERTRRSVGWNELPTHVHLHVARHGTHRAE
ncbi:MULTISPECIES: alkaline shock response membrane anchor protein AmaP [unclassified Streptomyces]|uniref:alkaline shock response membrane anchor protein AmaP n=1 Tax=unclassified Streptomyces TaxID=2593676 RepID=UPI00324928A9